MYTLTRTIELKPSRLLGVLLAAATGVALAAIAIADLPVGIGLALALGAPGLAAWSWRRATQPVSLRLASDGRLQSLDAAGEWRDAEVLHDSFVSPALIVLRYRPAGGAARTLTLLSDSADGDALRRLRVSLRWTRRTRSDTSSRDAG